MSKLNLFREIESMIDKKIRESDEKSHSDINHSLEVYRQRIAKLESDKLDLSFKIDRVVYEADKKFEEKVKEINIYKVEIEVIKEILRDIVPDYKKHDPREEGE